MRHSYEPCTKHGKTYCSDSVCKREEIGHGSMISPTDNAGSVSISTDGGLAIGLGGGLSYDTSNGEIGFQVGGITID